jgi:peroxiredoxin Q/BCP
MKTKKPAPKKSPIKKKSSAKEISKKPAVLVGKSVPAFELDSTGEKSVALKKLKGKKVVLYFYPKDSTPGCTIEGQDFSRLLPQFKKEGAEVFGVSRDSMKSHENFKAKQNYTVDLLSDEDEALCQVFGVIKMKNMYGRQVRGIERSTFVIDQDGKLVKEWRGVKVPGHAEEVLDFVKSL